jgi:hypothetical protein
VSSWVSVLEQLASLDPSELELDALAWGGETSCDNGALICERHHTAVHEGGFRVARDPGTATWRTYRPDGTEIVIRGPAP